MAHQTKASHEQANHAVSSGLDTQIPTAYSLQCETEERSCPCSPSAASQLSKENHMERTTTLANWIARLLVWLAIGATLLTVATPYTLGSPVASAKGSITKSPKNPYSANGKLMLNDPLSKTTPGWQLDAPPHGC